MFSLIVRGALLVVFSVVFAFKVVVQRNVSSIFAIILAL